MSLCLVLPLKSLREGKTRLSAVLDEAARAALIERLLAHVLAQATGFPGLQHTFVVSPSAEARAWAHRHGTRALHDRGEGLNAALTGALCAVREMGYERMMVVPCDLSQLAADDLRCLAAAGEALALSADHSGQGTNGLCLPVTVDFPFAFGPGSLQLHLHAAQRLRLHIVRVDRPGLALDIDTPADLRHLHTREAPLQH
jgi:2-phospho-L-lactate guanylyltransferase